MQVKTFTAWCNQHLAKKGLKLENISADFESGVLFCELMDILSGGNCGKYNANPKMRVHKVINVNTGLDAIKAAGIKLIATGAEDIVDGNLKLILGTVWLLIQKYDISEISVEEKTAKEGLLLWCKKKTAPYDNVNVSNFHMSFQDGLAFCALIHAHKPNLIDYASLQAENKLENLQLALDIAENQLHIPCLLDPADMVEDKPDERSVMAQVAQFFKYFSEANKENVAGTRLGRLVSFQQEIAELSNFYIANAQELVDWMAGVQGDLEDCTPLESLEAARAAMSAFTTFKSDERAENSNIKTYLDVNLTTLQMKLRSHARAPFVPPSHLTQEEVSKRWKSSIEAEQSREIFLRSQLSDLTKNSANALQFEAKYKTLEAWIGAKESALSDSELGESLAAVVGQIRLLEAFDEEYRGMELRMNVVGALANALGAAVSEQWTSLQQRFAGLEQLRQQRSTLLANLRTELELQDAKMQEFASHATAFHKWTSDMSDTLLEPIVANSSAEVAAVMEGYAADDQRILDEATRQLQELQSLQEAVQGAANRYTVLTAESLQTLFDADVRDHLAARTAAAQNTLVAYQNAEAQLAAFDAVCARSSEAVAEIKNQLSSIVGDEQEGELPDKLASAAALKQAAEEQASSFDGEAAALEAAITATGINLVRNATMASLRSEWTRCIRAIESSRVALERLQEMKELLSGQQEELAARAAQENAAISFAKLSQALSFVLDQCDDVLAPIVVDNLQELESITAAFEAANASYAAGAENAQALTALIESNQLGAKASAANELSARYAAGRGQLDGQRDVLEQITQAQQEVDALRQQFAQVAGEVAANVAQLEGSLLQGDKSLEEYVNALQELEFSATQCREKDVGTSLSEINSQLSDRGVTDNQYTSMTFTDVSVLVDGLSEKIASLMRNAQNEVAASSEGKATPEQIKEFRDCFKFFDSNKSNDLNALEFKACLASLGEDCSDAEVQTIMNGLQLSDNGNIEFNTFVDFMISHYEDAQTKEQILESFKTLAGGRDAVTEDELRAAMAPEEVAYLLQQMPSCEGGYDYVAYAEASYQ